MEKEKTFEPFERVILKNKKEGFWFCEIFCHENEAYYFAIGNRPYLKESFYILPFSGNEHLVGTNDIPEEEVELKEGDLVVVSDSIDYITKGLGNIRNVQRINDKCICISYSEFYKYCIPFSQFNPNDMEETKKHILCVNNGRLVRYNNEQ